MDLQTINKMIKEKKVLGLGTRKQKQKFIDSVWCFYGKE